MIAPGFCGLLRKAELYYVCTYFYDTINSVE